MRWRHGISGLARDDMSNSLLSDPEFAHHAADLMAEGRIEEAAEVCRTGIRMFPWYATGFLLLGSCYEIQGKPAEASEEYRNALQIHPDNYVLHRLLAALERQIVRPEIAPPEPPPQSAPLQVAEEPVAVVEDVQTPEPEAAAKETDENGVEFLIRRLQEAKTAPAVAVPSSLEKEGGRGATSSSRIVTVTLAEIYAHQGEYAEAARAYRRLIEQRPDETERFEKRALELEELANMKKGSMGE
jgi:tetratricopeptide (TPR) repeat protein